MKVKNLILATVISLFTTKANALEVTAKVEIYSTPECAFNEEKDEVIGLENCPSAQPIIMRSLVNSNIIRFKLPLNEAQKVNGKVCNFSVEELVEIIDVPFLTDINIFEVRNLECD